MYSFLLDIIYHAVKHHIRVEDTEDKLLELSRVKLGLLLVAWATTSTCSDILMLAHLSLDVTLNVLSSELSLDGFSCLLLKLIYQFVVNRFEC